MTKQDIWYSSLTESVFMWKSKEIKWAKEWVRQWVWEKTNITSKFLFLVSQYFEVWTSRVITWWESESFFIHIENTKEAKEKLIKLLKKQIIK